MASKQEVYSPLQSTPVCCFYYIYISVLTLISHSSDGFQAAKFHQRCDNKGPTLTIIRSHPNNYLFGGYTPLSWDSSNIYKNSPEGFIFTLTNPHGIPPTKYSISNPARAIRCRQSYGPAFGSGYD